MPTELQRLAAYYNDILTALAENSSRALRDLRMGRTYGLVADLSVYGHSTRDLLTATAVRLDGIMPALTDSAAEEPSSESEDPLEQVAEPAIPAAADRNSEGPALLRIWRKQKQDPYNRETLLGVGLLRGPETPRRRSFGPLVCFRVRPEYDPEARAYSIEKISGMPFSNLTLLGQMLSEDELTDIRPKLHDILSSEDFDESHFERLAKAISGATISLNSLTYAAARLHGLAEVQRVPGPELPFLATGAVLLNVPRGNAYLLDDLAQLSKCGNDDDLARSAIGPILEVPSDDAQDPGDSLQQSSLASEPLFPLENNSEQRTVAQYAERSRVLVVHGPPGTGKSQTICNLISHLVANGKTVLVTSQKDKALEVVRDKLPQIDYLAMALLRSDQDSQKSLLQALEYSRAAAGVEDGRRLESEKQFIQERLAANRGESDSLTARFSDLCRLENQHFNQFEQLGRLRNTTKQKNTPRSWLRRVGETIDHYRLSATAARINKKNPDDTRNVSNKLRSLTVERRDLVCKLLSVQRRLQLHKAAHSKVTSFTVEKAKRLLSRKRKTTTLEKLKASIDFENLLQVFPCWILSIDDVARLFPLQSGLFDYLIVDEASQCNQATALHLAFRAKRMVVVGDEKQLPNSSVQWLRAQTVEQLLEKNNLADHPKKDFLSAHESLLGLALASKDREVHLIEHFRCDPRIIAWSNRQFYGSSLRIMTPLRSTRFSTPIEIRLLRDATEHVERHVNEREANAATAEVIRILNDPKLDGLSIGVISPFREQADLIFRKLQTELLDRWSDCEKRGLTASTADGFQGDERDIVLYSLRHGPGSRPASISAIEANQGEKRINVAFTRARRKIILFTSLPVDKFPGKLIRSFLEHGLTVAESPAGTFWERCAEDAFDSGFESDVCQMLRSRGLQVASQYPAAGYRIDLAVRDAVGRRIGIECDGQFHYDELGQLREQDYERQEILERAGWLIHRIPARRFYLDPDKEIELAVEVLSAQPTDQELFELERDDVAALREEPFAEPAPQPLEPALSLAADRKPNAGVGIVRPTTATEQTPLRPETPSFDAAQPWIHASRWAREVGRWSLANRVFLWEVGKKIREGEEISEPDRSRAVSLWADALRQGYRPTPTA